jgi:hypothetical protein
MSVLLLAGPDLRPAPSQRTFSILSGSVLKEVGMLDTIQHPIQPRKRVVLYTVSPIIVALSAKKQWLPICGVKPRTDLIKAIFSIVSSFLVQKYAFYLKKDKKMHFFISRV